MLGSAGKAPQCPVVGHRIGGVCYKWAQYDNFFKAETATLGYPLTAYFPTFRTVT
ncbi:MAG: hypothetical protein PVSMB1_17760 [Gemmatimonadaceae bacterium]